MADRGAVVAACRIGKAASCSKKTDTVSAEQWSAKDAKKSRKRRRKKKGEKKSKQSMSKALRLFFVLLRSLQERRGPLRLRLHVADETLVCDNVIEGRRRGASGGCHLPASVSSSSLQPHSPLRSRGAHPLSAPESRHRRRHRHRESRHRRHRSRPPAAAHQALLHGTWWVERREEPVCEGTSSAASELATVLVAACCGILPTAKRHTGSANAAGEGGISWNCEDVDLLTLWEVQRMSVAVVMARRAVDLSRGSTEKSWQLRIYPFDFKVTEPVARRNSLRDSCCCFFPCWVLRLGTVQSRSMLLLSVYSSAEVLPVFETPHCPLHLGACEAEGVPVLLECRHHDRQCAPHLSACV
eukprot:Rhum_TRINITY_DN15014_c4_g1::Rhum_TRINITY_DN15014_c4_g1_i2::g.133501::m.133501